METPIPTLNKLWRLAESEAVGDEKFRDAFGDIGLFLERPVVRFDYDVTPLNSVTFASTGGDGVHFGLLQMENQQAEEWPVVMTVPMMFEEGNMIVGRNLHDFLCLGCESGYFNLEQLVYDEDSALEAIARPVTWADEVRTFVDEQEASGFDAFTERLPRFMKILQQSRRLLDVLRTELGLRPWQNPGPRLQELNAAYRPLLQIADIAE